MKKNPSAESPHAYVDALQGWRREIVEHLRDAVRAAAPLEEQIKWGHLVYSSNGPVLLIRAEDARVLFGFWRGKRLQQIEPALKPSGKYEMATMELREGAQVSAAKMRKLAREAVALNVSLGDPTHVVRALSRRSIKKTARKTSRDTSKKQPAARSRR